MVRGSGQGSKIRDGRVTGLRTRVSRLTAEPRAELRPQLRVGLRAL